MKNILVFGGSGFLGTYLVSSLLKKKYNVVVADLIQNNNLNTVKFFKCDILKTDQIKEIFKKNKFEIVFNLAGFANLDDSVNDSKTTFELNVIGNINIIEKCIENKVKKYIYASSAYAMSNKGSFYGISKLASEKIIEEYHKNKGLQFIILRYGSIYSEKPFHNNYIYKIVKDAITKGKINHQGSGNEYREYIHADDASDLSLKVLESTDYNNKHIILTGSNRIKRIELFKMIEEILNKKIKIKLEKDSNYPHYEFTPYSFEPSISKKLVSNPHIDLGQGLLECVKSVYKIENL